MSLLVQRAPHIRNKRAQSSRVWLFHFSLITQLFFSPSSQLFLSHLQAASRCHKLHRNGRFLPSVRSCLIPNSTIRSLFTLIPLNTQLSHPMNRFVNISWVLKVG